MGPWDLMLILFDYIKTGIRRFFSRKNWTKYFVESFNEWNIFGTTFRSIRFSQQTFCTPSREMWSLHLFEKNWIQQTKRRSFYFSLLRTCRTLSTLIDEKHLAVWRNWRWLKWSQVELEASENNSMWYYLLELHIFSDESKTVNIRTIES